MKIRMAVLTAITFWMWWHPVFGQEDREVMGYYAGWKWYDRSKLVNPQTINYSNYTIIAYAFFKPLPGGTIVAPDPNAEQHLLSGIVKNGKKVPTLISEAHKNGVKVLISVGGWTYSDVFPGIASSPVSRAKFAASCVQLVRKYGVEGIDIDWEYPGYAKHGGSSADTRNFTLFLRAIREQFDVLEAELDKKLYITAAFGVSPERLDVIEWEEVTPLLDLINLMSYNYSGPWDEFTGHHAPLYAPAKSNPSLTIDHSVKYLQKNKHVPSSKINIGLAFFGRASITTVQASLGATSAGSPDLSNFPGDGGAPEFYRIMDKIGIYDYHWDAPAAAPYLTGRANNRSFVTYDDERSIRLKADYVVNNNLRGVILWEITGEYLLTGKSLSTPLSDVIWSVFRKSSGVSDELPGPGIAPINISY